MNKPLLKQIAREIAQEPLRLDMTDWINTEDLVAQCHTTACIAGWACVIDQGKKVLGANNGHLEMKRWKQLAFHVGALINPDNKAIQILGITKDQANALFLVRYWPEPFGPQYLRLDYQYEYLDPWTCDDDVPKARKLRRKMTAVAIKRIRHFVRTGK
jgi:hypothetical protein